MTIEKMLTTEEEKKNMLETIVMHAFDMLRQGVNINPALDISNQKKAIEYARKIDRQGHTAELYNRIMAGLV